MLYRTCRRLFSDGLCLWYPAHVNNDAIAPIIINTHVRTVNNLPYIIGHSLRVEDFLADPVGDQVFTLLHNSGLIPIICPSDDFYSLALVAWLL